MARARSQGGHSVDALNRAGAGELAALAERLTVAGIGERAVCACFGVASVLHAPLRAARLPLPVPLPPAAVAPWLLVGGHDVPRAAARARLGDDLDRLAALQLVAIDGDRVVPRLRLLPVGEAIAVCLPRAPGEAGSPDDSTGHLLGALGQQRVDRWLDIGTGNAVVPLAARGRARQVIGADVDRAALACARAGAALSGAGELTLVRGDLASAIRGRFDRITFNAPLDGVTTLLPRFYRQAAHLLAPGGEMLVHSILGAAEPDGGAVVIARYTPDRAMPAFGVTWWRPDRPASRREIPVALTPQRPHVTRAAMEA